MIYSIDNCEKNVTFEFNRNILKDVIDWFGSDIILKKSKDENILVAEAKVNENAIRFWALQYGENVTVKSPKSLVKRIKEQLKNMNKRYK